MSRNQAAKHFGVAISTAINWMKQVDETGSVAPGQMGDDFTLRGLVAELAGRGLKVDYHSMWDFVHGEKLSFKKSVVAGERDRPDVARRRAQWQSIKVASKLSGWSSSTRPGPIWLPCGDGRHAGKGSPLRFLMAAGRP
jgi:hypothetical protein